MEKDRIEMSQRERDVLKVMAPVLRGERTQIEAARLLGRSVRQVRRIHRKLEAKGDKAVIHQLRGRPSNAAKDSAVYDKALKLYREQYLGLGPTMAAEKLAGSHQVQVSVETLRQWLLKEKLWERGRHRDRHRSRRERRACFGEMIQADASEHDWLCGRGPVLTLVGVIDDASSRIFCRFYESETSEAYMDLLWRWIKLYGRPVSWYSDRHGIFRAESRLPGVSEPVSVPTQFSRALEELDIELIAAASPQAKGRVERLWGTAQDRLVKELTLAKAATLAEANAVVERVFVPWFNRRCTVKPISGNDAHRPLGKDHDLSAIFSIQEKRTVGNDYTIRFENRVYQLLPPVWPGERGGKVVVEKRLDGSMKIRFKDKYLDYKVAARREESGALPPNPRSLTQEPIPAEAGKAKDPAILAGSSAAGRPGGRSGRTPALPCPSAGGRCGSGKNAWRPAENHPFRKPAVTKKQRPSQADISILEK